MYYINYFFISSILGFLLESGIYIFFNYEGNSGYLYGPWTPIYGLGTIIIVLIFNLISKLKLGKFVKFLVFYISICVILSTLEFIGGNLIELIFNKVFWDYSNHFLHIGKYISVPMALLWGIVASTFVYLINPLVSKISTIIPTFLTIILIILFIIDNIVTIILNH